MQSNSSGATDFLTDEKLEEKRFLLDEKKMQVIQLESRLDALSAFNSNSFLIT